MRLRKKNKITEKKKELMRELRGQGLSYEKIAQKFKISYATVMYHLNEKTRERMKNAKRKKPNKKEYMQEYMKERYTQDPKFREKQRKRCRDYQRKKREEKNKSKKEEVN